MCLIGTTERRRVVEYPVARRVVHVPPVRHETVIVERPRSSYHTQRTGHSHSRRGSKASVVFTTPRGSHVSSRRGTVPVIVERTYR
ncbi:hypothetical protein TWF173_007902 [Orbilia oligospora]|uniref:Uncharacterized protein n=2 Tax=Orbilia oligospora TaxID=2813651 RepID=G1XG77_ARTOA|nr:hypothetical protein AOL_s00083g7 [Orbilia oligospora ATCC 24927]EGX47852.1 hypothetical protein AOL_s00083g7 [Orbilia oligospora ATCC 24927]KAF3275616.1 hypothetical protein TWF970_006783 [Orbilia oligospora]KAF3318495.1 hypothetical protein TWF173_007902 [Orbilia oligospora]